MRTKIFALTLIASVTGLLAEKEETLTQFLIRRGQEDAAALDARIAANLERAALRRMAETQRQILEHLKASEAQRDYRSREANDKLDSIYLKIK